MLASKGFQKRETELSRMVGFGVRKSGGGNSRSGAGRKPQSLAVSPGGVARKSDWTGPLGFSGQKSPLVGGISRSTSRGVQKRNTRWRELGVLEPRHRIPV